MNGNELATVAQSYEFERQPGESVDEFRAFLTFCDSDAETATDYLMRAGASDLMDSAERWNWMRRRDALWAWRAQARKQRWLGYMDAVLEDMAARKEYHRRRIRFAENYEGLRGLTDDQLAEAAQEAFERDADSKRDRSGASGNLSRKYADALALYHKDAELALKVLAVMKEGEGVTVNNNNQIANVVSPGMARVKAVADEWGPPR